MTTSLGRYAIGFGAKPNFEKERSLKLIEVKNLAIGVNLGLVYDMKNKDHALIRAALDFARSKEWSRLITKEGYLPPDVE